MEASVDQAKNTSLRTSQDRIETQINQYAAHSSVNTDQVVVREITLGDSPYKEGQPGLQKSRVTLGQNRSSTFKDRQKKENTESESADLKKFTQGHRPNT